MAACRFTFHFLGWRVISGSTALGWHERVKGNAAYYAAAQVKEDAARTQPQAGPGNTPLSRRTPVAVLRPRPHRAIARHMYDTQSQFFDQTIRDWRWTGDPRIGEDSPPGPGIAAGMGTAMLRSG